MIGFNKMFIYQKKKKTHHEQLRDFKSINWNTHRDWADNLIQLRTGIETRHPLTLWHNEEHHNMWKYCSWLLGDHTSCIWKATPILLDW